MRDIYSREYTELKNAPHFIFNGKHTRDFNVTNVNVDTGLAEDTFLANRSLITERTRYSDKSYLLGVNDEPLQFKIRLLFDEHKFTNDNIRALKRWLYTDTFKEFVFDNEEESSIKVIFYAMVVDASTLRHNVINDGYLDLTFMTNSSKRYSEIMTEEYDFTETTLNKVLKNFKSKYGSLINNTEGLAKKLKQYIANTNYAGIEEFFKDKNVDRIPDGWKLISGTKEGITLSGTRLNLNNIELRKNLNLINGRNYYLSVKGSGGKIRIHENDYDIDSLKVHEFKYRKNILGNSGTFDLDSSEDGVGEGWTKVGDVVASIDKNTEVQTLTSGQLSISPTFLGGQKYVLICETPNADAKVTVNGTRYTANDNLLTVLFTGKIGDKVTLDGGSYSHLRIFALNSQEHSEFSSLNDDAIRLKYPHSDNRNHFHIKFNGTSGYIDYIRLYELSDLDKSRIDKGAKLEDIVGVNYKDYISMLNKYTKNFNNASSTLLNEIELLSQIDETGFTKRVESIQKIVTSVEEFLPTLVKSDNIDIFQWEDVQPDYKKVVVFTEDIKNNFAELVTVLKENEGLLNVSLFAINKIQIYNFGDVEVYPTFEFTCFDDADIEITNNNTGQKTLITDNLPKEIITMIGASEKIKTSRPSPYFKYDHHDDEFIELRIGHNELQFKGNIKIKIKYQFVLL